jgi:hypothetical protein
LIFVAGKHFDNFSYSKLYLLCEVAYCIGPVVWLSIGSLKEEFGLSAALELFDLFG